MNLPWTLHWRIAVAYTALIFLTMGAVAIILMALVPISSSGRIFVTIVLTSLVGGAISVWLAFILARTITLSVQDVADGAQRLAEGDLDHRVRSSTDETRGLAEAFNRMAGTIRDTVGDLDAERSLLAVVMDTMADGVIVLDSENRVRLINRAAQWLLTTSAPNTEGRPLAEVVRDHEVLQLASNSASTGQIYQAEIELLHQRRFLNVIATPISDDMGQGVLLTLQDVTHLRQLQTTRREFVSNVSHELRSPLASVKAMVETLEHGAMRDPEIGQDFLGRIQDDIERMTTLVDELLELSRLESGQMPVHLGPIDLTEAVEDILNRFELLASTKEIELVSDLPPDIPYVMAETGKLDQILTNLVENAMKFTSEGGRISFSARSTPRWVEITVADTGVGIPREHLPHVFERFYKVDRSRRDEGTGLGLAIVKHLVEAHGGDISVTSTEGEGSSFTLTLRRAT